MRVTMTSVWDRTSEVIAGRAAILAGIAVATLWLPVVVQLAIVGIATDGAALMSSGASSGGGQGGWLTFALTIVVTVISYWGKLAIIAMASDPAVTTGDAYRGAARRLPVLLGLLLIVLAVIAVAALPVGVAIAPYLGKLSDYGAGRMSASLSDLPPGRAAFVTVYLVVLAIALLWSAVRIMLVAPVVLLERRGIGSFARSFALTRGHFWRLFGVLLLFGVVLLIATSAARSVTGVVARLLLGPGHVGLALFVASLFTVAVAVVASVVSAVFVTRFYLLRAES